MKSQQDHRRERADDSLLDSSVQDLIYKSLFIICISAIQSVKPYFGFHKPLSLLGLFQYSMATSILIKELLRKSIHLTSLIIVLVYVYLGKQIVLDMLTVYLVFILLIEHLRLSRGTKIPFLDFLYRDKERSCIGGHVFFVLGSVVAVAVYSKEVAIASVLMLTFGDMAGSIAGITVGKTHFKGTNKSLEGSTAEFVTNLVIGNVILQSFAVAFVMAAVATLTETWLSGIDDNLSIPVFAGFSAELLLLIVSI